MLITYLDFLYPCRLVNRRIIERLKRDFEGEGYIKDKPNRVLAMIDDQTLQVGLEKLATTTEAFKLISRDNPQ